MAERSSRVVIYAALVGNLAIAVTKFIAAAWTGSSAMLSEGIHSLVDTGNQLLMLYGIHRAARPPDDHHPLGYGRELYFWSFVVALLIFAVGAGISFYEGVVHLQHPGEISNPVVNYVVLALSACFEATSWWFAWREFNRKRHGVPIFDAVVRSRDPTIFVVLLEDSAALIGIAIAFAGTFLAQLLETPVTDGLASIGIGLLLAATATFLAREAKGLLIGEPAREATRKSLREIAARHPEVGSVGRLVTVHLAPHEVIAGLDVDFRDDVPASTVERTVAEIEAQVRADNPDVTTLFIRPTATRGEGN